MRNNATLVANVATCFLKKDVITCRKQSENRLLRRLEKTA
jgi:hypothetical protein